MDGVTAPPRILRLTGWPVRVALALYFVETAVLTLWTIGGVRQPALAGVALGILAVVCIAFAADENDIATVPTTVIAVVAGPLIVVVLAWQLTYVGYNSWFIGTGTMTLYLLSLRGRPRVAWAGYGLLAGTLLPWAVTSGPGLQWWALTIGQHALILLVGSLFAAGLRRIAVEFRRLSDDAAARATSRAAQDAQLHERRARMSALESTVGPLLRGIASGASADPREYLLAEAGLRDGLRARALDHAQVRAAARAARERGVEVVLMDDTGSSPPPDTDLARFIAELTATLNSAVDGRVTARLLPRHRGPVGTIVADGTRYARFEVA